MIQVVHSRGQVERFARVDPHLHLFELGDLDDRFWPDTLFWGDDGGDGKLVALCTLYAGPGLPTLLAFARHELAATLRLLEALRPRLPRRFVAHLSVGLEEALRGEWALTDGSAHWKMGLVEPARLRTVDTAGVERLGGGDRDELEALYAKAHPGTAFDPRTLDSGPFFGVRVGGELVSAAGVHVYSEAERVAVIGNVATDPPFRGRGLARRATAALCEELSARVDFIGLNVAQDNAAAIACYRRIGFDVVGAYREHGCEALGAARERRSSPFTGEPGRVPPRLLDGTLFAHASDAVFVLRGLTYVDCNAAAERQLGCRRSDLLGAELTRYSPEKQPDGASSRDKAQAMIDRALDEGEHVLEWEHRRFDGSSFTSEIALARVELPGESLVLALCRDITLRKRAEDELRASEARFRSLIEQAPVAIGIGRDGAYQYANPLFLELFGFERGEALRGRLLKDLIAPRDRDQFVERILRARRGSPQKDDYETIGLRKDGSEFWCHVAVARMELAGDPVNVAFVYDISARKAAEAAEREAREKEQRQERMLLQAGKMSSLGLMVSGVAHELNNPNNFILLNVDLVRALWGPLHKALRSSPAGAELLASLGAVPERELVDQVGPLLDDIAGGSRRISRIVGSLKDFARVGTEDLHEVVSVSALVDAVLVITANMVKRATRHFSVCVDEGLPELRGNFQKLEQVLINLLANACQALPSPDRAIEVHAFHDASSAQVRIAVRDAGVGIREELLDRVMDPFFTTKRDSGGTGLGLAVSFGIMREHGGALQVVSRVGEGTTMTMCLPLPGERGPSD